MDVIFNTIIFIAIEVCRAVVGFGTPPTNVTALVGNNATFTCEISDPQTPGNDMQFYMTEPIQKLLAYNSEVQNNTKYSVNGAYNYTIHEVSLNDEGRYECILFPNSQEAYLKVVAAPLSLTLTWSTQKPIAGSLLNLTCASKWSKPPARITWYRNDVDITRTSVVATTTYGESGFGDTTSVQQLLLKLDDNNSVFRCSVNIADLENVTSSETKVTFASSYTSTGNINTSNKIVWILHLVGLLLSWTKYH